ncbi:MAG: SBBP repeat-containing protein [Bacteroidota bacterium]
MYLPTSTLALTLIQAKYAQGKTLVPRTLFLLWLFLSSFLPVCVTPIMAQMPVVAWTARYNGSGNGIDQAVKTVVDAAGNVYVTGNSDRDASASVNNDIVTIKYNAGGVQQWLVRYNGPANGEDVVKSLVVDAAGNVYITGSSTRLGSGLDMATIKYNAAGIQQWVKYFDAESKADEANALALDAAGNVYVTGYSAQSDTSEWNTPSIYTNTDYTTLKYTSAGVQQWVKHYGSTGSYFSGDKGDDVATAIVVDAAGNTYIAGTSPTVYSFDCLLIKYSTAGVQQWLQPFVHGVGAKAGGLALDASGNICVSATSIPGDLDGNPGVHIINTAKYNAAGSVLWNKVFGEPYPGNFFDAQVAALAVDAAGNIYMAGTYAVGDYSTIRNFGYLTLKYNASGIEQWRRTYQGAGTTYNENDTDNATALAVDATSNVYVTGAAWHTTGGYNYTTFKYNAAGTQQWVLQYNGPANGREDAASLALGPNGSIHVTGASYGGATNQDFATIKYAPPAVPTCAGTGSIRREYWANVVGNTISSIPVNAVPTSTSLVTSFEGPTNVADNYAARYRGYLCVPTTGQYRFAIAGDNEVELWLSTSENAANKQKLAFISGGYTNPRQWTKYATQQSALVTLQAGQRYYIEALHKEGTGGDNLAVGWQQPGSAVITVIPGTNLIPFQAAREAALEEEVIGLQAYPNPFSSEVTVNFTTAIAGRASLDLYDLRGVRVQPLFERQVQAGESHQVVVEGSALQNGLYLIRLVNGNQVSQLKVMLAK